MSVNLNIKIDEEQKELLKQKAKENGMTLSGYIKWKALN